MRTRVKFCGITNVVDALKAAELGADAIGLNFCKQSSRYLNAEEAQKIITKLPPFVTIVGIFANATQTEIEKILQIISLDRLQFHGDESVEFCEIFQIPYYKAIRMQDSINLLAIAQAYSSAEAILVDAYHANELGGTGHTFDWQRLPTQYPKPLILAGGLTPENIFAAIKQVHPYAVDVSSGIEKIPRIKDHAKMSAFINEVNRADQTED